MINDERKERIEQVFVDGKRKKVVREKKPRETIRERVTRDFPQGSIHLLLFIMVLVSFRSSLLEFY